jgi:uncharacterized protein
MIKNNKIIAIFAKPPLPGKTKRRLAEEIGDKKAAEISAAMLTHIICEIRKLNDVTKLLFHPPDSSEKDFTAVETDGFKLISQKGNDLGERMSEAYRMMFSELKASSAIIVGSDCITHTTDSLIEAFDKLEQYDVVIQPAQDGGYVLVGESFYRAEIFNNIEWGTEKVMKQTEKILQINNISYMKLPESFDIDRASDLECSSSIAFFSYQI